MNMARARPARLRGAEIAWWSGSGSRLLAWWPAKLAGTMLGLTAFFAAYFWVLRHPQFPVTLMPLTTVDRWIGFQPAALPLYLSLWFYVSLAPALLVDRRELASYGLACVALSVAGLGIFLLWPTAVPPPDVDWLQHPSFAFLKAADATGNACPSLHVAFAVFSAVWFERLLGRLGAGLAVHLLNWAWCLGILYSTIAIRQHVFLDVFAGAGLGALAAGAHLRWLRPSG
ncbi:PAP2 superfamily protein [Opitutus sp. GAS368]|nr:PAP2 superfamily protein [Opitutus sp. GAS368]